MHRLPLALAALLVALPAFAQEEPPEPSGGVGLTIYSSADPLGFDPQQFLAQQRQGYQPNAASQVPGFGVIRDTRTLTLNQGVNEVRITDVAEFIDPTSVILTDLSPPEDEGNGEHSEGLQVVDQSFEFDLVSPAKLLEKYIDREITVNVLRGDGKVDTITGTLLSTGGAYANQLVLSTPEGTRIVNNTGDIQLGELPEGLITRPTLQWRLWAPEARDYPVRTAYQADGITWRSDYNLVLSDDETTADLGAWVTILNLSGARFADANLKLIAGDVQRFARGQQPGQRQRYEMAGDMMARSAAAPQGFEEESFFEYHLYTLPRPATIEQNSTQQIALFPTAAGVNVEKILVYYGLPQEARYWVFPNPRTDQNLGSNSNTKVDVYLRFDNEEDNQLGIPLPKGKVRVFKQDTAKEGETGTLEFIGEDLIDHTPKGNEVLIKIGQSFDVTGTRTQTDYKLESNKDRLFETFEITLKNAKKEPQKVLIRESLYRWVNWEITEKSDDFEKVDHRTVHFPVTVPAEGEKTITYTVRYSW